MQDGAAHVEAFAVAAMQNEEVDDVDDEAEPGDDQHRSAQHRRRVVDAVERLDSTIHSADGEDGDAVGVGDQRLDPVEAVGEARGRLPVGEVEGIPGEPERDRIRQHVAGVGQQRERSGVEAAEPLPRP